MVILSIIIISKIQKSCIHLFQASCMVDYLIFQLNILFLKTIESEFSYIEVWFTDQNSKPLEIEDKINITLVTN